MSAVPVSHATRCVRYRFRYSECRRCAEACPHEAIVLSDEGASIKPQSCRHCGLCVDTCRTESFSSAELAPLALIEKARDKPRFAIACAPSGVEGDVVVPCLGALGPAVLAYLVKQGTELSLAGSDHCAACAHGARGSEMLALNLEAVESLRRADAHSSWAGVALPLRAAHTARPDDDARRASRRGFFRRLATPAASAAPAGSRAPAPAPLRAIRAARVMPGAQRDLLQMLGLGAVADPATRIVAHPALPAGHVRLDSGCTGCEACARACPTGALQVRESTTQWALGFEASLCVGCGVCVETCQPRVMHLDETLATAQFARREAVALLDLPKRRCARCDRSFIVNGDASLCDVCTGDDQDFTAIFR